MRPASLRISCKNFSPIDNQPPGLHHLTLHLHHFFPNCHCISPTLDSLLCLSLLSPHLPFLSASTICPAWSWESSHDRITFSGAILFLCLLVTNTSQLPPFHWLWWGIRYNVEIKLIFWNIYKLLRKSKQWNCIYDFSNNLWFNTSVLHSPVYKIE